MDESRLAQVQRDLDAIKAALPTDFPYDRGSVALCLGAGLGSVLFAVRAVPGWDGPVVLVLLLALAALLFGAAVWLRRVHLQRAARPRRWNWNRQEVVAAALALLGLGVYVVVMRWLAPAADEWDYPRWRSSLAGPGLFAFGLAMFVLGVSHAERRSFLGWAVAMVTVSLLVPWLPSYGAFQLACGGALALGSVVSATILWIQVRRWEARHAGD